MEIKNIIKNKKGEIIPRTIVITILIFTLITGIGFLVVNDISSSENGYNIPNMSDSNFQQKYSDVNNISDTINIMKNKTLNKEGLNVVSTYTTMFKSTFSVIALVFGSIGMINTIFLNIMKDFGISATLGNLIIGSILAMITTVIMFAVLSSVSRGRI